MRGKGRAIEWPTVALAAAIHGGWASLTFYHDLLSPWLAAALGALLIAWHSSFQHETIHGHPTPWPSVNRLLGALPLSLWLPYERYRATHLQHHRDERITDPLDDPESAYLTPEEWRRLNPLKRTLIAAQTTLLGRLVIGPAWSIGRFLAAETRAIIAGDRQRARIWAMHLGGVGLVLCWLGVVCGISLWLYALAIVYPGTSLILLRAFAEHRAAASIGQRTAIVETAVILGPLFLFNNLHAVHHAKPGLPWYALPRWYRRNRAELAAENGGLVYSSYFEIARRFLLRPHDTVTHPLGRAPAAMPAEARL